MSPLLYDEVEARRMLGGIGRTKLYRMGSAGELTPVKIGRRTFFAHDDLEAYVTNLRACGPCPGARPLAMIWSVMRFIVRAR